ncbi:MAG: PEP-CTERM sorting domain-containing protein [Limisphaerales bacterium]
MKTKYAILSVVSGALLACSAEAQDFLSLNFASTPGSTIQFNGAASSFQFNSSSSPIFGGVFNGTQWQIGSQTGGTGSATGLLGWVNNSPFSYGSITTIISGSGIDQTANVSGSPGALLVNDGSGFNMTGLVNWGQISTHDFAGAINASLTVNVTGLSYAGSNPDLLTFVANSPAALNLTFQFSPGRTLSDLTTGSGAYQTSYSGSLSVVPEPTSVGCFILGLGVLAFVRHFKRERA